MRGLSQLCRTCDHPTIVRFLNKHRLHLLGIAAVVTVSALALTGPAGAARAPTLKEREALTQALPARFRAYPVGCVWLQATVSGNGGYALVRPTFLNALRRPCIRYASNGYWILKRGGPWKIVFNGSDPPPCALQVPRELAKHCLP
jgi:hypothetical protein